MASSLTNAALSEVRPAHASYYGDINEKNPVIVAVGKELDEFRKYIVKSKSPNYQREPNEAMSRGSNWLFDIWNKYALRLPTNFYYDKLIQTGDFLLEQETYDIALYQCYNRFLSTCHHHPLDGNVLSAKMCETRYFADGFSNSSVVPTVQALLGALSCQFHMVRVIDQDFVRSDSVLRCVATLRSLQSLMQCLQKHEQLYWVTYNCTIKIYEMCRKLMVCGKSIKIVEYLVWACMCMETSIPLLSVHFLTWRVTLYTAVCLAYYDCKAGALAEKFARRALTKLQELSELESMSGTADNEMTRLIFQQATVKMAAMVFKRTVFESRRRPKGILRPKMRNNLKEAASLVWPRTQTEKLLGDMFVGSSAQFLAIIEALTDSHRRSLQPQPPAAENDVEMLDVFAELIFAGKEIIAGGGGDMNNQNSSGSEHSIMGGMRNDKSLIQLAAAGEDGVTLVSVVRFIKLAFCYEQWDTFTTLLDAALMYIKKFDEVGETEFKDLELCLAVMLLAERVTRAKTVRKIMPSTSASALNNLDDKLDTQTSTENSSLIILPNDDLINLAEAIYFCASNPYLFSPIGKDQEILLDRDMVLDVCILVWRKTKSILLRIRNNGQIENASPKWMHLLQIINSCFVWCGIASEEPTILADVALHLASLLESSTTYGEDPSQGAQKSRYSVASDFSHSQYHTKTDRLSSACEILSNAINSLCAGITQTMSFTGADKEASRPDTPLSGNNLSPRDAMIQDFLVELLNAHHRIYLKLAKRSSNQSDGKSKPPNSSRNSFVTSQLQIQVPDYGKKKLLAHVRGNLVSNALLHTQRATVEHIRDSGKAEDSLTKAVDFLTRAEEEERRLCGPKRIADVANSLSSNVPPPPILLARSNTTMLFKPAPFQSGTPVSWYRLLGRTSAGHNVKVRLNDYFLSGTGNEVPAGEGCVFRVDGLKPNERYVFAVAAYSSNGTLIGNGIGATSEVIPAHYPMSILNAWCILAESALRVGSHKISKQSAQVLWDHFVQPFIDPSLGQFNSSGNDFELSLYKLNKVMVERSSEVLIRHTITSIFISVEVAIMENSLFSTKLTDGGPLLQSQIARLRECEKMLVAIELCSYLGDINYLIQAATKCFGLMIPMMQADIYVEPVVQVLVKCHIVLCEACAGSLNHFPPMISKSIHHMVASITFYLAKVFRAWGRSEACMNIIETGKQLLTNNDASAPAQKPIDSGGTSNVNVTQARKKGAKVVPKSPFNMSHELAALEERLAELTKEKNSAGELTGGEDASTVLSYIVAAKPLLAYKELSKFRRRSRYLEYFVHVMHKALINGMVESAIEWSQEVLQWLRRRNEGLTVNHTILSLENGAVVMQGNDANKYAAVIVNHSKGKSKQRRTKMLTKKSKLIVKGRGEDQEDMERKALTVLEKYFSDMYKGCVKKRKLRKLTNDEMPWRSRFNHLVSLLYFDILQQKLEKRLKIFKGDVLPSKNINLLDQNQWSLSHCGSIVVQPSTVSYSPVSARAVTTFEERDDTPGQALLNSARKAINAPFDAESAEPVSRASADFEARASSPQTQRTNSPVSYTSTQTVDPAVASIQNNAIIDTFRIMMLSFRRSLVLAHRGKLWTLLQNVSKSLISCLNYAFENTVNVQEPVMNRDVFQEFVRLPLALASDFLLDMLVVMQCHYEDNKEWPVGSYAGNIHDEKGGRNLHFDEMIDDCHEYDFALVKTIIFKAIEVLHFQGRWEQLVDICLRFSSLTHDRFAETILPIMIHAQHEIKKRVEEHQGANVPQIAWDPSGKTVKLSNENYILSCLQSQPVQQDNGFQMNIGGYIDPAAHDVYGGGKRALALSSVPYTEAASLNHLHLALKKSLYFSRALIHSRRLLGLYLSSQYNKRATESLSGSAHHDRASSVSFVDVDSKNQACFPSNMTHTNFETIDDVENSPFTHLPTVMNSYTKTIELLISHGETDLVSQAYHELGNLYLHSGNTKAALKSWTAGLDQIFAMKGCLSKWRSSVTGTEDIPEGLLQHLGFWGCQLSIVLACKIGEFSSVDVRKKTNCAILAAYLVQALFRSTMNHPTSTADYISYEIFPVQVLYNNRRPKKCMPGATSIFPDVDMFSDAYRCEPKQLMSSLHWLCENLVQLEFNLKALPCLCLYQYIATFVCKDIHRSVQCRCIKLTALNNIRAFDAATNNLFFLLYGSRLPHQTEHTYREPDSQVPSFQFMLTQSIDSLENLKAMEVIASKRISPQLSQLYGPQLTCEITIQRTRLLVELADCILCLPQRPSQKDLILISAEPVTDQSFTLPGHMPARRMTQYIADDTRSTVSAMSTTSTSMKQFKKLFSKRDTPMTIALLKGILLGIAEAFLNAMMGPILSTTSKLLPSELWIAVQCRLQLCAIEQQRQHSTFAASHALKGLQLMQNSGRFEIIAQRQIRKIRSALKNRRSTIGDSASQTTYMEKAGDNLEQKYRSRLNARLWLTTRLKLCKSVQGQITGLGKIWTAMADKKDKDAGSFLQLYCAEGLAEAEICNDCEMQASFLLSSSTSDSLSSEEASKIMEDAISTLDELPDLSDAGTVSLAFGTATAADLQLQGNKWTSSHAVQEFHNAHAIILLHLMQHGETIRHFENSASTVDMPLKNLYSQELHILSHIKLRIGHANYFMLSENSPVEEWQTTAEILQQAKSLNDSCAVKDIRLQAEVNFELAKVTRALYCSNGCDASTVKRNLQDAVKASPYTFPVLSRNGQLESAMLGVTLYNDTSRTSQISSSLGNIDQIAMALHSAHCIAKGEQSRSMLQGNTEIVTGNFSDQSKKKLPDFILLDLATDHKKTPSEVTVDDITIDPHVAGVLMESGDFTWIHVLYYRILLLRKFSSLRIGEINRPQTSESEESDILDFYPGEGKQMDQRSQAVKTPIFSTYLTVRLLSLHDYLKENLPSYQDTCRFPIYDGKSNILLIQWYKIRQRKTLLWCATGVKRCGRLLVSPSDITRLLSQIKTLLQKVEIHFGQTMPAQSKQRSRNIRQRKQTGLSNIPAQLEDDVKQTLTNCALLFSPDHDVITTVPFQITVNAIEHLVDLFTIGCCYTDKDPLYSWLAELLVNDQ